VPGIPLHVNPRVAPLHQALANELKGARQPGAPALSSSGGYIKRRIAGTNTWSQHSWGLAADFNAPTNPYTRGSLVTDFIPSEARRLAAKYGMSWGGAWTSVRDAMHFEFAESTSAADRRVAALQKSKTSSAPVFSIGSQGAKVMEVEIRLSHLVGFEPTPDHIFDQATFDAVKEVQALMGFTGRDVDGLVGPKTLTALDQYPLPLEEQAGAVHEGFLPVSSILWPGDKIVSPNEAFECRMQTDGNVVVYGPSGSTWQTGLRGTELAMQRDGNLVLYATDVRGESRVPVWNTNTADRPGATLVMQDDGNLVVSRPEAHWHIFD
jgi:hypothetical protein